MSRDSEIIHLHNLNITTDSRYAKGDLEDNSPHFCLDGTRDFLKLDEKIGVGRGSGKSSEK